MLSYAQLPIVKCTSSMHFPHIITMYETGRRANLTDKCVVRANKCVAMKATRRK